MPLPTADSLLPGVVSTDRALSLLEASFLAQQFSSASADNKVAAVANGMVELASLTIDPGELAQGANPLAGKTLLVCGDALARANADSAPKAAAQAGNYNLPGVAGVALPPPTDDGFDVTVARALAAQPGIVESLRQLRFEATDAMVRAVVDGTLALRVLEFSSLPAQVMSLQAATVAAINTAIRKAKNLFEATASQVVEDTNQGRPVPVTVDARPLALLVTENVSTSSASDAALKARLAGLGFNVEIRKAPSSATADANGRALIVISESVDPNDVGTKFVNAVVPMVVCEPVSFRDLKMTGGTWGTDKGDATNQTKLQITAGHVLAAGLSGQVTVVSAATKFVWGNPAAAARKVAAIVGSTTKWGIFAYDTGETMVGMNAPARRVGFFAGKDAPALMNASGWALFDAAVRWATAAKALLTVKTSSPLTPGDAALKQRLEDRHGLEVLLRLEGDTRTNDLADLRLHVISESVSSTNVAGRYLGSPAPTIVLESNLYDDMKLTGAVSNTDFGEIDGLTDLEVLPGHPLAAGLSGVRTVVSSPQRFGWGKPGVQAIKAARIVGRTEAFGIFAYEGGANMVGTRAAAPRVGFYSEVNAPAAFTPDGLALFDAAVAWVRAPRALLIVKQNPLRDDDEALRKRLAESFGFVVDVKLASEVLDVHADGHHLIVVSESIASSDLGAKMTSVAVPLVSFEPAVFDDLKMTGSTSNTDFGAVDNQTDLEMVKVDHPLAAGLSLGQVKVVTAPSRFVWGLPGSGAVKIARLVGRPNSWGVFGYENGATMVGRTAPARRVGCFVGEQTALALNDAGRRLFDAAILWAAGRIELRGGFPSLADQVRGAGPPGPAGGTQPPGLPAWKVGVAYNVGDQVTFDGKDFRCRQSHTSQADWTPPATYALWERINAGQVWTPQVIYKVGDEATHLGHRHRCLQGHQAQPDWEPQVTPALWQKIS